MVFLCFIYLHQNYVCAGLKRNILKDDVVFFWLNVLSKLENDFTRFDEHLSFCTERVGTFLNFLVKLSQRVDFFFSFLWLHPFVFFNKMSSDSELMLNKQDFNCLP